jgi:phosphate transport system permease protein
MNSGAAPKRTIAIVHASLKRRHARERRFRLLGLAGVGLGLGFVALLLLSIVAQGWTAFQQTYIRLPVTLSAAAIDPGGEIADPATPADIRAKRLVRADFRGPARDALRAQFPSVSGRNDKRALDGLLSSGAALQLRRLVGRDPALIGREQTLWLLADDDLDMYMKGRSTRIDAPPVTGTARPSGTEGAITIHSTADDFGVVVQRIRAFLQREATGLDRDIARLGRVQAQTSAALAEQAEREPADAAAEGRRADVTERLQQRLDDITDKLQHLESERAEITARMAAAEGGETLKLGADMPSFLVSINGGMARVQEARADRLQATAITPLGSQDPAAPGNWRLLELKTPESDRRLSDQQIAWILQLEQRGLLAKRFNVGFFTNGTSREPELAGIASALVGSFYTLLLTLLFSFPIAVGAAVYLEEFAPKNRFTDLIEVNINNLAAVPSIVFGLLGLAVFINFFGIPRSTPLVAAMVLTLMTLPTIIIASRAALKSVPPSIREAALGVGASPLQTQIHHVLPLALPGMLTGTIIGMAQALGETAPLLMIGLIAFIVDIPGGITDPATVLPVQIFMWADSPERGFVERTSAAIMILLGFLVLMNLTAVLLRRRFERRW